MLKTNCSFAPFTLFLFVSFLCSIQLSADPLNGRNVGFVTYTGSEQGSFEQQSATTWFEFTKDNRNPHARFTETGRDEWSVYLTKSDGAKLQLDLHTKKIMFNGRPLYQIADARTFINGYTVTEVVYTGSESGRFKQLSDKKWAEYTAAASTTVHATFTETHRDEWSVYLTKHDGAKLQLDLYQRKVLFNGSNLYSISKVSDAKVSEPKPVLNGRTVGYVVYGGSNPGSFEQQSGKKWHEYVAGNNTVHATFTETGRDEWSVYLTKSDGARLQLDLHTKQVKFNGQFLYPIADAAENPPVRKPEPIAITGKNVRGIEYSGRTERGSFRMVGPKQWAEYVDGNTAVHATFVELGRDDWSVYLRKSDGANLQIDLHTKKVMFNGNYLYKINSSF